MESQAAAQYLTYRLGAEEYGIAIHLVQEIRSYEAPTRIPGAPHFIKGVVNLRGAIVPIVDLRLKLGCEQAEYGAFTVVIVLSTRERRIGVVVDSVSDVLALTPDSILPPPQLADEPGPEFVTGIASVGSRLLMIVDLDLLLGSTLAGLDTRAVEPEAAPA